MNRRHHIATAMVMLASLMLLTCITAEADDQTSKGRPVVPGSVLDAPPEHPSPDAHYLIYLHGAILESEGPDAVHPRFGRYEYSAILDSLAVRGLVVISQLRAQGADPIDYSKSTAEWVNTMIREGVPPEHITVAGFSKGGGIAMDICRRLSNPGVNYVFMACCPRAMQDWPEADYRGRILSIYEKSDDFAGSCREAILGSADAPTPEGIVFKEIEIDTGLEHGAFYRPRPVWVDPVVGWAMSSPE